MNLVGTLGKLLLSGAMSRGGAGAGGLGSLLGGATQGGSGGLTDLLGSLAGGGGASGGLGDLLGQMQGQQGASGQSGGAGGLLGALLGGGQTQGSAAGSAGGMGALLGNALGEAAPGAQAPAAVTQEQTDQAALMIRAMVNAAKADGAVDAQEQENIVGKLGDIGPEEAAFIRAEMQAPLDVDGFIRSVPRGLEQQIYVLSLMTVNLDSKAEADYLDKLAKGFNITEQASNQIHSQLNVPQLYS